MSLECAARIDGIFAIIIVSITSGLFRAAARPVLHHCIYALISPSVCDFILAITCLESVNIGTRHVCIELRALSECAIEACPTWFCSKVYLRRESCGNTQCPVLVRRDPAKFLDQSRIECSSHAK